MENGLGEFDELLHQEGLELKQGFTESLMSRIDQEQIAPVSKPNGIAIATTLVIVLNLIAGWAYLGTSAQEKSKTDASEVSDPYVSASSEYQY